MKNNISTLLLIMLISPVFAQQSPLKLNIYGGFNTNSYAIQENFYNNQLNPYYDYLVLTVNQRQFIPNIGIGLDYALNEWQSLRFGAWVLNSKHEVNAFGPSNRSEFITNSRTLTELKFPLIYSHQVVNIKRYSSKMKLNIGTSADYNFSQNQDVEIINTGTDAFQLTEVRYNPNADFTFRLLTGLEFQFYNKNDQDKFYIGITRNYGGGNLLSDFSYIKDGEVSTYQTYKINRFWSFNLGYLLPTRKAE